MNRKSEYLSKYELIIYKSGYALLAVFFLGIITIIVTRILFYIYHPEYFLNTIPTISKSAAYTPGSYFFMLGMNIVSICSFITWYLIYRFNTKRIKILLNTDNKYIAANIFNFMGFILGTLAALFLALFTNISLEDHTNYHISFSKYFFFTEIFAFIMDSVCCSIIYNQITALNGTFNKNYYYLRYAITLLVILSSLIYFFLFENRGIFNNVHLAQLFYVITEHVTAILCFSYAAAYFPDINKHIDLIRHY